MKKRIRSMAALMVCVICIFSGCAEGNEAVSEEVQSEEIQSSVTQSVEETQEYVQPEMKGEITITCLSENELLTAAARKFMSIYPDVTVTIHASEAGSTQEYQTYLNTKIMSGKAEDIIFNSFLPIAKYTEMGVFEDLSKYIAMTPEFNDENYFMNVLCAAGNDSGEIPLIPYMTRFHVIGFSDHLLAGQGTIEDTLKTWENTGFSESMELGKKLAADSGKENVFLLQGNEISYVDSLIRDSFSKFINIKEKQVNLDTPEYINLLNSVKELSQKNMFGVNTDFYNTEYYFAATVDYDVQAAFYDLSNEEDLAYSMPLADTEGKIATNVNYSMARNSASSHKDLAWEFMKYLLSEDVQTMPSLHGLAVNRIGFEASAQRYYSFYTENNKGSVDAEEYAALLEKWTEQINSCDMVDAAIWDFMDSENSKFFSGEQTAETTAKNLQQQINQYLNE